MQYRTANPVLVRLSARREPADAARKRVIAEYDQIVAKGHRAEILYAEFHGYRVIDRTENPW